MAKRPAKRRKKSQKQAEAEGMVTMIQDGFLKAVQGVTSIEEILRGISE
ncbi:MAG: hypothetical protein IIC56_05290 [Proteobacteria bacterium]|nr:hypothetical protein [Pseudomonadota bacterium]